MQRLIHAFGTLVAAAAIAASSTGVAVAQTTGSITGLVTDQQGGVLPGATVTATHDATGTSYEAAVGADGRYSILNVRVGSYTITVHMDSFRDVTQPGMVVGLGAAKTVDFRLELATVQETITVTASSPVIDLNRAGTASSVSDETIEKLPTISRSLFDFARLSPFFVTGAVLNDDPTSISVAGQNNRYNNIQIDGAVNNDLFGLSGSGTPGGQTEQQPISLDAIRELQLVVSPYDVRQGGFAGGGLNAVTVSGTNRLRGTVYYFGRDDGLVGKGPSGRKIGTFNEKQFGASAGGPIVQDKAFFFGNFEIGRRDRPSGVSVNSSGQQFGHDADVQRFLDILKGRYSYDPTLGGDPFGEFTRTTNNDKIFARGDFNIQSNHQLTVRHSYGKGRNDIGFPSTRLLYMPDNFYQFRNTSNSTVAQLNSTFGSMFNELRVTYQRIRDNRDGQTRFPFVRVFLPDGSSIRAGTENFSTANRLDQDVIELTNDLTWVRGTHTLTLGTHNEFFTFDNLFIRDNFGNYTFNSLDLFEQGLAQSFDYSFSATSDPQESSNFAVRQWGFYAGDQWRARPRFTLTYGVRVDLPTFPDKPTRNPLSEEIFGLRTDTVPSPAMWSPRVGFNYAVRETGREQIRGGLGLFSGRTPYVWLSNQYGNTGIEFTRLSVFSNSNNRLPFVAAPDNQPTTLPGASVARNEIDLIDPDYVFPRLLRGNIGYDRELGLWGLVASAEMLFTSAVRDIKYQNLNLTPSTTVRPDGRPVYTRVLTSLSDVIYLTNTNEGAQWNMAFKVDRPYRDGWLMSGSYAYGRSKSIMDGTSSQAASNWGNVYVPGDPNNPPLATSVFEVRHRMTLSGSYDIRLPAGVTTTISAYYNAQTGRPYSMSYNNTDVNGDGRTFNDLFYLPSGPDDVELQGGTWADLDAFLNADPCGDDRGRIAPRNCAHAPWVNQLDLKLAVGVPIGRTKAEFTLDFLNFLNMFDKNAGTVEYANFNELTFIQYRGVNAAGKYIYNIAGITSPTYQKFLRDDLRSRWQAQFGARFRF